MLPVTIVPRTVGAVGAALTTGGTAAVQGIAMLNPQRWGGTAPSEYSRNFETNGHDEYEANEPVVSEIENAGRSIGQCE
jgi:recyclin-1